VSYVRIPDLVSVIVPTYNGARYIKSCLNSVLQQSYKNMELIIINDGSTDHTKRVLERWKRSLRIHSSKKSRIVIVTLPRNIGFAGAVHTGLFVAKGEFIAMQDSDDLSHQQRIQKQVEFLRHHPEIDLVGTNYASFPSGSFHQKSKPNWLKYGEEIKQSYANGEHCICHGTILLKSSVFDKFGGHSRKMDGAEDYEFIANCISNGVNVENIPEVLYYYRSHSKQRSSEYYD
jgi:glycosyltransferase involved in cell wall biosynthesis